MAVYVVPAVVGIGVVVILSIWMLSRSRRRMDDRRTQVGQLLTDDTFVMGTALGAALGFIVGLMFGNIAFGITAGVVAGLLLGFVVQIPRSHHG